MSTARADNAQISSIDIYICTSLPMGLPGKRGDITAYRLIKEPKDSFIRLLRYYVPFFIIHFSA